MPLNLTNVIPVYKDRIDSLIDQLGKDHMLYFDPTITEAPQVSESDSVYGGSKRPNYKSDTTLETTDNILIFKGLIQYNPKDDIVKELKVMFPSDIVRIKTYISYAPDIRRAKFIIPNYKAAQLTGEVRYTLQRIVVPRGLRENFYCVSYWTASKQ